MHGFATMNWTEYFGDVVPELTLTTHREESSPDATSFFQHEAWIAAISIFFFRYTVRFSSEPWIMRIFCGGVLAYLAFHKEQYELITAVEIFTYCTAFVLFTHSTTTSSSSTTKDLMFRLVALAVGGLLSFGLAKMMLADDLGEVLSRVLPDVVVRTAHYLFPIQELFEAFRILDSFSHPVILRKHISHLLFVTFHIQIGMGFLGISFLRAEQTRRNQLIRLDVPTVEADQNGTAGEDDKKGRAMERSRRFQRGALPFILFTALPYMFQIILFGNINSFSSQCVLHDMHKNVRLKELFDSDNRLSTMAAESATSPEGTSMLASMS